MSPTSSQSASPCPVAHQQEALRLRRYLIHYFAGLFAQHRWADAQRGVDRWRQRLPAHPHEEAIRPVIRRAQDAIWDATGEGDLP